MRSLSPISEVNPRRDAIANVCVLVFNLTLIGCKHEVMSITMDSKRQAINIICQ